MKEHGYAEQSYRWRQHRARYKRFIEAMPKKLICQDCGGAGGEVDVIFDGTGPWEECGWCEGTGYVTPHVRAKWLKWKREEKTAAATG